jgi:acetylglutamate kinase
MKIPRGFLFSGVAAGIKPMRKDLAMVWSETEAVMAACFTQNRAKAAPILDAEQRVPCMGHGVLINSGNANALTGAAGIEHVVAVREAAGKLMTVSPDALLTASTGVIGVPLPVHKITDALPALKAGLSPTAVAAAEAIMTTDTRIKMTSRALSLGGKDVLLSAICKGSGMIAPQLATMIAVITTDCAITPPALQSALSSVMAQSFNALTVDDDMSTNDAVFAMANGSAKNAVIDVGSADYVTFRAALLDLCQELTREIAADGEGATKRVDVSVRGCATDDIAMDYARSIAGSSLVKAALFGADPNWGRVLSTVGARSGSQGYGESPYVARVTIQGVAVFDGSPLMFVKGDLRTKMREPIVQIDVDLRNGDGHANAWGCDLSYDYVKINADYTSLVETTPDGGVRRDNRFTNYSPKFKVSILTEALSYIEKFKGKLCVIKVGGEALLNEALKHAFVQDIALLRSVGLVPVVVHGGEHEIRRTISRLGTGAAASEDELVEMVVNGKINVELVSLLNRSGVNAVGLSGKDANLLSSERASASPDSSGAFRTGALTEVREHLVQVLLGQGYVPVISPTAAGEDGQSYHLSGDDVAAGLAIALGAHKLIFLADAPGLTYQGELLDRIGPRDLAELLARAPSETAIEPHVFGKAEAAKRALSSGVSQIHFVDGRMPHGVLAELFTDNGLGTLVQAGIENVLVAERLSLTPAPVEVGPHAK